MPSSADEVMELRQRIVKMERLLAIQSPDPPPAVINAGDGVLNRTGSIYIEDGQSRYAGPVQNLSLLNNVSKVRNLVPYPLMTSRV